VVPLRQAMRFLRSLVGGEGRVGSRRIAIHSWRGGARLVVGRNLFMRPIQ